MIHVVIGPPCAGKSTYVKDHRGSAEPVADYDLLAEAIGAVERHHAEGHIKEAAFHVRQALIDYMLDADTGWIIHTSPTDEWMQRYREHNADIITLDPGKDECLRRAERDNRPTQTIDGINDWYARRQTEKALLFLLMG